MIEFAGIFMFAYSIVGVFNAMRHARHILRSSAQASRLLARDLPESIELETLAQTSKILLVLAIIVKMVLWPWSLLDRTPGMLPDSMLKLSLSTIDGERAVMVSVLQEKNDPKE